SITVTTGTQSGIIQVTPSNACGNGTNLTLVVTVSPLPASPGTISGNFSICQNSLQTYFVIGIPQLSYNWSIPTDWTIISGQGTNSINVIAGISSGNIIVTPLNSCGNGIPTGRNVIVNPNPAAYTGPGIIICEGASAQLGHAGVAGNIYRWTSSPSGFTSSLPVIIVTPAVSTTYFLVETDTVTNCISTNSVTVSLNQIITITVVPVSLSQTICSGGSTHITLTSNITGTVFSWVAVLTGGAGTLFAPTGSGHIINEIIENTSGLPSEVTYNITAMADVCKNTSTSIVVTINPSPLVNSQNVSACSDVPSSAILGSSANGVPVSTYNITNINSNGLVASGGNPIIGNGFGNNIISDDSWTNITQNPVIILYTVVPVSSQGCTGPAFTLTLTVNPKPVMTNSNSFEICSGAITGINLTANIPSTYSWTVGVITGGITGATAGSGTQIAQVLNNPDHIFDGTVTYNISLVSITGFCVNTPFSILVTVHPKPVVTNLASVTVCSGAACAIPLTSSVPCSYTWVVGIITGGITGALPGNGNVINQVLNCPGNTISGTVQYNVIPTSTGHNCQGNPFSIIVTVNPLPVVSASSSVTSVCPGNVFDLFSSSNCSLPTVILSEGFANATNNWTRTNISTGGVPASAAWTLRSDGYVTNSLPFHSNDASQFYMSDSRSQNGTVTSASLVSPLLNTTGYASLSLSFWHYYDNNSTTGESAKVEVSNNNGTSWTAVAIYTADRGTASAFQNENINLGSAYINSNALLIRFNYYCGSNRGRYWAIDNVTLTGTPAIIPAITWTSSPVGFISSIANPANVIQTNTTNYTVNYIDALTGCNSSASVVVAAYPAPAAAISAEYCIIPGKIKLTASGGGTYLWSTGATSQVILVDIAGVYSVVVTNAYGCSATAFYSVSTELVINGNFSLGNSGFLSGYVYDPTANGLIAPESEYAVNNNAQYNHPNFWGYDHTSGTGTGTANYLIVNGAKYAPQPYVWRETVSIIPNTDYYFSAWAMSLNNVAPFAELRFSVNGQQVGTTALLTSGQDIVNNPWLLKDRFYGMWNSGSSTTALIEILDLNTSANGNDFGLDDISFGTLAQIPSSINPACNLPVICSGGTLQLYANISGGRPPIVFHWTGPNGFNSHLQDPNIPNIQIAGSGTYHLTVTDGYGCNPLTDSVSVAVLPLPTAIASGPTSLCQYAPYSVVTFTGSGGTEPYTFTYNINGGASQNVSTISGQSVNVVIPTSIAGTFSYNLVSVTSANNCSSALASAFTVIVHSLPTCIIDGENPVCPGSIGNTYSGLGGMSTYGWSVSGNASISSPNGKSTVSVNAGNTCNQSFTLSLMTSDMYGCNALCEDAIQVEDVAPPMIICPSSTFVQADAGYTYATVLINPPAVLDDCTLVDDMIVNWSMTMPTIGTGIGLIPSPFQFNIGVTTITYIVTDQCGNSTSCSFQVTVTPSDPPDITCNSDIMINAEANVCFASLDPGLPEINTGLNVIFSWSMTGATSGSGTGPIVPNPYTFNLGKTTIMWIASNVSGADTCFQVITVVDNQPPAFLAPGPFSFCVEDIYTADYYDPTMDIMPDRPEYYLLAAGSKVLDLDPATFTDNCGLLCAVDIRWRINFADSTNLPALPALYFTGQPSAYGVDIKLPGSATGDIIHSITYQIVDCNGKASLAVSATITITPRPLVIKQ
ncbi:MAG: PKD-like domain-containing protein, partial [Bacteroidota bacterium]